MKDLLTYKEVEFEVNEWVKSTFPIDYENGFPTHYKTALHALGFYEDGYDKYGANAYTNGHVRVTVYYDRSNQCYYMEESQGSSETTDNFYNTGSEYKNEFGIYGKGSYESMYF